MSSKKETDGKNIEKLYTHPSNPGAFSGEAAFVRSLKNKKINKDDVKNFWKVSNYIRFINPCGKSL
jgi:hypothetical protein